MEAIELICPECAGCLTVEASDCGQEAVCPLCGKQIMIPPVVARGAKERPCPHCGSPIAAAALRCKHCGKNLILKKTAAHNPTHDQSEVGGEHLANPLNPNLNGGGLLGALIGALIPVALYFMGFPYSDSLARLGVICLAAGALVGNYIWALWINKGILGAFAIFLGLFCRVIAAIAIGYIASGVISRFTGGEDRQEREAVRRALIESGLPATPEAIDEMIHRLDYKDTESIRRMAEKGDAKAQSILGTMYAEGNGVAQDLKEALKWTRKSADQDHAMAQLNLGATYLSGEGVNQDYGEAAKWFRKAAEQGVADAQYTYGVMRFKGMGVPADIPDAVKWVRLAAEQGLPEAESDLGDAYLNGNGVPQNDAEALKWFRKAADQGYPMAQNNLAAMYDNGRGVPMDDVTAVNWYRKAADQGYAPAQFNLGVMYDHGEGVKPNKATAKQWLRKAAAQGHAGAQEALELYGRD